MSILHWFIIVALCGTALFLAYECVKKLRSHMKQRRMDQEWIAFRDRQLPRVADMQVLGPGVVKHGDDVVYIPRPEEPDDE